MFPDNRNAGGLADIMIIANCIGVYHQSVFRLSNTGLRGCAPAKGVRQDQRRNAASLPQWEGFPLP